MNVMDGFLTTHLERTFYKHEAQLIREYLGAPEDVIECPTESQRKLFGPTRRRVPKMIDLTNPVLLGPVQNQEHYMQGVVARRDNFVEPILDFFEAAYQDFAALTGRYYGLVSQYRCDDADTVFVSLGSAAENIEAAVDYLRAREKAPVGSIHINVFRPFPEAAVVAALAGKKNVIILERTDEPMAGDNPMGRDIRTALNKALQGVDGIPKISADQMPRLLAGIYGLGFPRLPAGAHTRGIRVRDRQAHAQGRQTGGRRRLVHRARRRSSVRVKSDDTRRCCPTRRSRSASTRSAAGARSRPARTSARSSETSTTSSTIATRSLTSSATRRRSSTSAPTRKYGSEKKGAPDVVLHDRGARAHSGQLRPPARQRRPLLRPQGLHAHQPARRHG
jgi:hypothetical protein